VGDIKNKTVKILFKNPVASRRVVLKSHEAIEKDTLDAPIQSYEEAELDWLVKMCQLGDISRENP
jgi:hypothetical protein